VAIDLIILGAILIFGLLGAVAGAAQQIAQLAGLVAAYLCARPLGRWGGPNLAHAMQVPELFGVLAATLVVFIVVLVATRIVLAAALRRLMARKDPKDRGLDRTLGLALGALKVAAISYVLVSALVFAEENVVVAGKRLGVSPKDSWAFRLARSYNLFEMTQFAPVNDFVAVTRALERPGAVRDNPALKAVREDPRFRKALADEQVQRALEAGDYRALLRSDALLQLIQDPTFAARLESAARNSE
jgi:membrane protein required for colicin V production